MKHDISSYILWICLSLIISGCNAQTPGSKLVGEPCEGCEAIFEYDGKLSPVDTLPDFNDEGRR